MRFYEITTLKTVIFGAGKMAEGLQALEKVVQVKRKGVFHVQYMVRTLIFVFS